MNNVWRFTGNPENWITAITRNAWALNENNQALWASKIKPGDVVLFHSTKKTDYPVKTDSAIIGFGYVGEALFRKDDLWWVQEIQSKENFWPYVVPLKGIYIYSDISSIDLSTSVSNKPVEKIVHEIQLLLKDAVPIKTLNASAKKENSTLPNFPLNGSASRVNEFYEELLLKNEKDLFAVHGTENNELLEHRSAEKTDYYYRQKSIEEIKKDVLTFKDSGELGYKYGAPIRKIRIENQLQKRKVARLENYTCQICGFYCEYTSSSGNQAWIYDVDHIIEKLSGGTEEAANLWVLCPNCHRKKTLGVIAVNLKKKKVFENGKEVALKQDNHLFK